MVLVLIVAKCIVNFIAVKASSSATLVLIVAKCIVNVAKAGKITASPLY